MQLCIRDTQLKCLHFVCLCDCYKQNVVLINACLHPQNHRSEWKNESLQTRYVATNTLLCLVALCPCVRIWFKIFSSYFLCAFFCLIFLHIKSKYLLRFFALSLTVARLSSLCACLPPLSFFLSFFLLSLYLSISLSISTSIVFVRAQFLSLSFLPTLTLFLSFSHYCPSLFSVYMCHAGRADGRVGMAEWDRQVLLPRAAPHRAVSVRVDPLPRPPHLRYHRHSPAGCIACHSSRFLTIRPLSPRVPITSSHRPAAPAPPLSPPHHLRSLYSSDRSTRDSPPSPPPPKKKNVSPSNHDPRSNIINHLIYNK